jgi:RNA polymerase sigma factor (sigma-70 family)
MAWKKNKIKDYSDAELIDGCIRGNSKSQEVLYKRYFSFAMSVCIRYVPNQNDAMEVVNDSYLKAFEGLGNFDTSKPFKAWFAKILVNTAIDSFRRNARQPSAYAVEVEAGNDEAEPEIEQTLSSDDIIKLFAKLPDNYRLTFNLYELEGYSHEEIGRMLGVTTSTSRSNLTRAKKMIQKLYKQQINAEKQCHEAV